MSGDLTLKPWASGPFELIRHAEGHLENSSDFDKRMALISFDNAIEVSIATYLQLSPMQRGNQKYKPKEVEDWLRTFYTKLQFLKTFIEDVGQSSELAIDELLWYHQLRNEIYHSGNGMVPEEKHLHAIRSGAHRVFLILFGTDPEPLLKIGTEPKPKPRLPSRPQGSAKTRLLESYIDFEKAVSEALERLGLEPDSTGKGNPAMSYE